MIVKKPKGATKKRHGSSGIASLVWMLVGAILTLMIGLFLYLWNPFNMDNASTQPETTSVKPRVTTENNEDFEFYELLPQQEISSIPDSAINTAEDTQLSESEKALQQVLMEPDVVVDANQNSESNNNSQSDDYGVTQDSTIAPKAATGNSQIVIVEEQGTYDGTSNQQPSSDISQSDKSVSIEASTPRTSYILQINSFSSAEEADTRRAQVLMAGVDARVVKKAMANGQIFYQVVSVPLYNRQAIISAQQRLQNNGIDSLIVEQRR